ncbi:MAG: hypothetical protein J7J98_02710 [candidate division Zixibacteria bacterium]|nr:hypothetical protein [candidate division Zixibacteria bacterium]
MRCFIWLAALAFVGCSTGEKPSESITISFNPPDSTYFVVELAMTRETHEGDQVNKDSTWTQTGHNQVAREGGFELRGVTDSITMFHNNTQMIDPLVQLFSRADITYVIDSVGKVVDVIGYEKVFEALDTLVGPDTAAAVRKMVSAESLRGQEIATWNQKFALYVGRSLSVGEPEIDSTIINLPIEGQVTLYMLTEVVSVESLNSKQGIHLRVSTATDPAELARLSGHDLDEIVKLFNMADDIVTRVSQRQAGSWSVRDWVIENETMLSHSETLNQEIFFYELGQSGIPVRNQMTETNVKSYTYPE